MKFYNITIGQLIVVWVVGIIISASFFLNTGGYGGNDTLYFITSIGVLGGLIFYTIGWKNRK